MVAVVGTVGVVAGRSVPVGTPGAPTVNGPVCAVLEAVVALLGEGLAILPDASAEEADARRQVNAQLAQRREAIMGLSAVREMGC